MSAVLLERQASVLVITLNRPERLNAINTAMAAELANAWAVAAHPDVRAVVLTGAGGAFCAGADLHETSEPDAVERPPPSQYLRYRYNPGLLALCSLAKPVICAVNGAVAGAGLGLALAADVRIASSAAKFVPSFIKAGVIPDMGVTYLAVRALGYTKAFDWLTAGLAWSAADALGHDLVQQLTEPGQLHDVALERARRLTEMPSAAMALTKKALLGAYRSSLAEQLELENDLQASAIDAPERAAARSSVTDGLSSPPRTDSAH